MEMSWLMVPGATAWSTYLNYLIHAVDFEGSLDNLSDTIFHTIRRAGLSAPEEVSSLLARDSWAMLSAWRG